MTTIESVRTQSHTTNTELRDRWRALAGLVDPTPSSSRSAGKHSSPIQFELGFGPVASPTRVRIGDRTESGLLT